MLYYTTTRDERRISDLIDRTGLERPKRYIDLPLGGQSMSRVVYAALCAVSNQEIDNSLIGYTHILESNGEAFDKRYAEKLINSEVQIAKYDGEYVLCYLDYPGLDICGLQLTYSRDEHSLARHVVSLSKKEPVVLTNLGRMLWKTVYDCQIRNLIKEEETNGVIYLKGDYKVVDHGYMEYFDITRESAIDDLLLVRSAREYGINIDELLLSKLTSNHRFFVEPYSEEMVTTINDAISSYDV